MRGIRRRLASGIAKDYGMLGHMIARKIDKGASKKRVGKSESVVSQKKGTNGVKNDPAKQAVRDERERTRHETFSRFVDTRARNVAAALASVASSVDDAAESLTRQARLLEEALMEASVRLPEPERVSAPELDGVTTQDDHARDGTTPSILSALIPWARAAGTFGLGALRFLKGGSWVAASIGLLATIKHDSQTGNGLRTGLRSIFGIDDPNEPAPWMPGGAWDKDGKSTHDAPASKKHGVARDLHIEAKRDIEFKARRIEFTGLKKRESFLHSFFHARERVYENAERDTRKYVYGEDVTSESAPSGGGTGGDAKRGSNDGAGENVSTNGKQVPSEVMDKVAKLARAGGGSLEVQRFMSEQGYPMRGNWCGEFAASVVKSVGGTPPKNPQIASSWLPYGKHTDNPVEGDIMVRKNDRRTGAPLRPGQIGGHVGFFHGRDEAGRPIIAGGNGGVHGVNPDDYEFRHVDPPEPPPGPKPEPEAKSVPAPAVAAPPASSIAPPPAPLPENGPRANLENVDSWGDDAPTTRDRHHVVLRDKTSYRGTVGNDSDDVQTSYDEGMTMREYVGGVA